MSRLQVLGWPRVLRLLGGSTLLVAAAGTFGSAAAAPAVGWQRELLATPPVAPAPRLLMTDAQIAAALRQDEGEAPGEALSLEEPSDPAPKRWWPVALSAVIPGLGEAVTGHKRGYFFIAADAASWYSVKHFDDEGNEKEDEYEAFALAHWSEEEWTASLAAGEMNDYFGYPAGSTPEDVPLYVSREEDEREWFENLGKWDVFYWGWDDGFPSGFLPEDFDPMYQTPNRKEYVAMRGESNDAFSNRDKFLTLNLITRVISVLDVAYLEGFIGGRYKHESPRTSGAHTAESLAQELAARELDPRLSLYLAPRGLDETRLGLRVNY
jgi:hypothetical protein